MRLLRNYFTSGSTSHATPGGLFGLYPLAKCKRFHRRSKPPQASPRTGCVLFLNYQGLVGSPFLRAEWLLLRLLTQSHGIGDRSPVERAYRACALYSNIPIGSSTRSHLRRVALASSGSLQKVGRRPAMQEFRPGNDSHSSSFSTWTLPESWNCLIKTRQGNDSHTMDESEYFFLSTWVSAH